MSNYAQALVLLGAAASAATVQLDASAAVPTEASLVIPKDFMSFSIETTSFADYAGGLLPDIFTLWVPII